LLGLTARGICWLSFVSDTGERSALRELKSHWAGATFAERPQATGPVARRIFPGLEGRQKSSLSLLLMGTNFQIKVWRALLEIPAGVVVPYEAIGARIGASRAARAIGSAVGQNAVAYLIPCHRVIRKSGVTGGYRWGSERKQAMLAWEAARAQAARPSG
jgi:AraC family transcriptional regulator of adaptative response/methylated-DNA-[protein]-cysteine methyltransferase